MREAHNKIACHANAVNGKGKMAGKTAWKDSELTEKLAPQVGLESAVKRKRNNLQSNGRHKKRY